MKPAIKCLVEVIAGKDLGPAAVGQTCHGLVVRAEVRPGEAAAVVCRSPRRALACAHAAMEHLANRGVPARLVMSDAARQVTRGALKRLAAEPEGGPHRALVEEFASTWSLIQRGLDTDSSSPSIH
jgi:hypothetical protein